MTGTGKKVLTSESMENHNVLASLKVCPFLNKTEYVV